MTISEEHISELADLLDCGLICYYHCPTGSIKSFPDNDDPFVDQELWPDSIDEIEADWDNYLVFKQMGSNEAFRIMEKFGDAVADNRFRDKIFQQLSKRKPFHHFKNLIDSSDYRQAWFDFKRAAYIKYVKEQVELLD